MFCNLDIWYCWYPVITFPFCTLICPVKVTLKTAPAGQRIARSFSVSVHGMAAGLEANNMKY
jgi:hypothetical protein